MATAELVRTMRPPAETAAVEWVVADAPVAYPDAVAAMDRHAEAIRAEGLAEKVWLVEHPPLYTAGTSARDADLIAPARFPVYRSGRGGQYTYHGPGQRVAYVMLDLKQREPDLRLLVRTLEEWIIATLAAFGVRGERRQNRVGIWVPRPDKGAGREDKIAAIGIRVRRWVTLHGIADQRRPRPGALFRHRAVRHHRPGRHQPRRPRRRCVGGRGRRGTQACVRAAVRKSRALLGRQYREAGERRPDVVVRRTRPVTRAPSGPRLQATTIASTTCVLA